MTCAVFAGSFDPLTNGHVDIVRRALTIFDRVVVAVLSNPEKVTLFSPEERVTLIQDVLENEKARVTVQTFSGLLVEFANKVGATVALRGLRAISDYEYEAQMALMNRHLSARLETVFLVATEGHSFISSSIVKQVARLGGPVNNLVPPRINEALIKKVRAAVVS